MFANVATLPIALVTESPWLQRTSRSIMPLQEPIYELPYTSTDKIFDNPDKWYWLGLKDDH